VLQAGTGDYTFANMRAAALSPFWASVAFLLALFGFGAKAGILPLHVWLPEAHPAAPSPVSALMSGVMLKTAIYGVLRVAFDLLQRNALVVGRAAAGASGLATALFGVVFSAVQVDMKRLLAYSSIENIGLIFVGHWPGADLFAYGMLPMAALALTAVLYHCLSHAFFKSLLFLQHRRGAARHRRAQPRQARRPDPHMPWVAWLALVGVLASPAAAAWRFSSRNGCCCRASCSRRAAERRLLTC
jgi:hydrogenase-4 component B